VRGGGERGVCVCICLCVCLYICLCVSFFLNVYQCVSLSTGKSSLGSTLGVCFCVGVNVSV